MRVAEVATPGPYAGKVVWITGASSGIGKSLAVAFSRAGAQLILSARRPEGLAETARACGAPADLRLLPFDLTDVDAMPAQATAALQCFGYVDYMVHNAGVALRDRVVNTDLRVDRTIMSTNYFGPVALTKALLPSMLARHSGCFVVMSSLSGAYGGPLLSAYAASKHALHGFFESLRAEVHADHIQVTIVIPGFIHTAITEHALTGSGAAYGKMMRVHARGMDPDRCAARILKAVLRRKEEVLVGGPEVYTVYLKRLLPRALSALVRHHPVRTLDRILDRIPFRRAHRGKPHG